MYCSISSPSTSLGPMIIEMNVRQSISACNRFPLRWAVCSPSPCTRWWLSVSWPEVGIKRREDIYWRGVFDVGWLLLVTQCHRIQPQLPRNSINIAYRHRWFSINKQTNKPTYSTCDVQTTRYMFEKQFWLTETAFVRRFRKYLPWRWRQGISPKRC